MDEHKCVIYSAFIIDAGNCFGLLPLV